MATHKRVADVCLIGFLTAVLMLYVGLRIPVWTRIVSKYTNGNADRTSNESHLRFVIKASTVALKNDQSQTNDDYITILLPSDDPSDLKLRLEHTFRTKTSFNLSTCPVSLQIKMKETDWTFGIYHPEVHLLMNQELLDQSEYSRLMPYMIPYGYRSLTSVLPFDDLARILSLFPAAKSIFDFPPHAKRPSCLSCAVVGNGGILKGSGRGMEIDDHHMVFRLNNAVRRGHEDDVGRRTTHYFFFDRSLRDLDRQDVPRDKGIKYVFIPCERNDYLYIKRVVSGLEPKIHARADDVRILHPDFIRYAQRIWLGIPWTSSKFRPSTGSLMLLTALHAGCDRVQVYGMGYQPQYSLYYFDDHFRKYNISTSVHNLYKEIKLLKRLHDAQIVDWYQRLT